jgi:hypothetical protein
MSSRPYGATDASFTTRPGGNNPAMPEGPPWCPLAASPANGWLGRPLGPHPTYPRGHAPAVPTHHKG